MRYADMPTAEVETVVHAPVDEVWSLVTDIDVPARFSSEFQPSGWTMGRRSPRGSPAATPTTRSGAGRRRVW
jgi:hypothetical protein